MVEDAVKAEQHSFEAEVSQLLKLMVHSVYSNKDIFLRELISNAADACEKLRYLALEKPELSDGTFKIVLEADENAKTLTISDNGVGMSRDELIGNLGTIARSGTKAFLEGLQEKADGSALIGQFGVGFYSAFMVASEVEVTSRKADSTETWTWKSDGEGTFTISAHQGEFATGTAITLHLNDDALDYAKTFKIEEIVREYSSHVPIPIHLIGEEEKSGESEDDATTIEPFDRVLSDGTALWAKSKSDISEEDYSEFYRTVSGAWDEPAKTIHYRAEGRQEYTVLTFIPASKPFDLFDPARKGRIKLYVRRVFISDEIEVLPAWLRFVRGVIDSEDLPLNISRELLQDNPMLTAIGTAVTKRILSDLGKMADKETETYEKVWDAFGPVIKEGLYEDVARRDDIYAIARFKSSSSDGKWRALKDYVADMKENQTAIYYALGESEDSILASPHLEGYRKRGIEVLFLSDSVDAFWVRTALGFEGKPFKSITQGSADLDAIKSAEADKDEEKPAEDAAETAKLITSLKEALGDSVSDVKVSSRLAESPVCLVASEAGLDKQLEKILGDQAPAGMGGAAPVLEINADHALIKKLAKKAEDSSSMEDAAWLLHGQAKMLDGEQPKDPARFAKLLTGLMESGL